MNAVASAPIVGLDRAEGDVDRELAAVLAPTGKLEPDAHRPRARVGDVVRRDGQRAARETLRQQHFNLAPERARRRS